MTSDNEALILNAARDPKFGLFEAVWTLNAELPDVAPAIRRAEAKKAVGNLLRNGYAELRKGHWNEEAELGEYPKDEWDSLMENEYCWERPVEGWYVILKPTSDGLRVLGQRLHQD